MKKNKTIYMAMGADLIHRGHIGVIEKATQYGELIVGVLTDSAIASYKRLPILDYDTRVKIISNIKGVSKVVKQTSTDYTENILLLKPDYVIHSDYWTTDARSKIINVLDAIGKGELIEVPYVEDEFFENVDIHIHSLINTPDARRRKLGQMLKNKPFVRAIEASNGLSGLIVENTRIKKNDVTKEYDAIWISSLCDSTFKGKPDIELVDLTSRINTINEIMEVTTKPIILDGDTGGQIAHFTFNVRTLERLGVSAIVIEDKTGLKQNSLFGTSAKQVLEDPLAIAEKISAGKKAQVTKEFMIFARLESLIAGMGVEDAINRAEIYINAGADGIMIHSQKKDGSEIIEFMKIFREKYKEIPLILVPTSYNHFTEQELHEIGANIIIHANHLLRSAYPAMLNTAKRILECGRSKDVDDTIMSIKEVLSLIPEGKA